MNNGSTENDKNYFDPTHKLSLGERANCILDWERRRVAIYAATNDLNVVVLHGASGGAIFCYIF